MLFPDEEVEPEVFDPTQLADPGDEYSYFKDWMDHQLIRF